MPIKIQFQNYQLLFYFENPFESQIMDNECRMAGSLCVSIVSKRSSLLDMAMAISRYRDMAMQYIILRYCDHAINIIIKTLCLYQYRDIILRYRLRFRDILYCDIDQSLIQSHACMHTYSHAAR